MAKATGSLEEYHRKRRFSKTPEPRGTKHKAEGNSFVIQKHAATRLHYDFRLELDGVLKSWAVPKGPSLDPKERHLAVHVEDHPLEYGGFEGIIPKGEYGGGTVMLWDKGTWEPLGDAARDYRAGKLKFELHGKKLKGKWMLIRIRSKPGNRAENWLLFKERDEYARSANEFSVTESKAKSVVSQRTMEQIAKAQDRMWLAKGEIKQPKVRKTVKRSAARTVDRKPTVVGIAKLGGVRKSKLPSKINVELATRVDKAPAGDNWVHEIKFDGYRLICRIADGKIKLTTRRHQDWTHRFRTIANAAKELPVKNAIVDGEVVVLDEKGLSSFQSLQNNDKRQNETFYYAFDLLFLDGHDLREVPLLERKELLKALLGESKNSRIRFTDHILGNGDKFWKEGCRMGLEGIVSKDGTSTYKAGRTTDWLKIKCVQKEEFVIGGYTDSETKGRYFGSLLVGYHDNDGKFIYAGRVGTGYSEKTLRDLGKRLSALDQPKRSFDYFKSERGVRDVHWVKPSLIAQVEYGSWTDDNLLRHAAFQGLREDKKAEEVTQDRIIPAESAERNGHAMNGKTKPQYEDPLELGSVRLTHPNRVLFPDEGITKVELAAYYAEIADWILPHVANRPLSLVRCPDGVGDECFYQKHVRPGTPESLDRVTVVEKNKKGEYAVVQDVAGLIALVQISVLEIHPWGSQADNLERPDRLILDLDPDPTVKWPKVVAAAKEMRDRFHDLGLASFVKVTGGKGLHVVVPIERRTEWAELKEFARKFARAAESDSSDRYTTNMSKAARPNKIFLDYLRNERGSTAVAAYSTRARPTAAVSVPLSWKELSARIKPDQFQINEVKKRLARLRNDPWDGFFETKQKITAAMLKGG
jgi:bifunctional non-homologous end joining protein LigD